MIKSQIIIGTVNHSGEDRECYIPQIDVGFGFKTILSNGSYLLKESHNPILGCPMCNGQGCKHCNNRGTIKGQVKEQYESVQSMLEDEVKRITNALTLLEKYQK